MAFVIVQHLDPMRKGLMVELLQHTTSMPVKQVKDGMPRSAIEAGLADVVAPAEELPGKIIAYLQHALHIPDVERSLAGRAESALEKILVLLRAKTGNDFSFYKKSTLYQRIERRMGIHQIEKISDYVRFLQKNPNEVDLLFKELLIGVTSFFRDPAAWTFLKEKAVPMLLANRQSGRPLRAWPVKGFFTG